MLLVRNFLNCFFVVNSVLLTYLHPSGMPSIETESINAPSQTIPRCTVVNYVKDTGSISYIASDQYYKPQ